MNTLRWLVSYLFPAALIHLLIVFGYNMLWLSDLVRPLDSYWRSLSNSERVAVYSGGFLAVYLLLLVVVLAQRDNPALRWLVTLGSRRGLSIGGLPLFDLGLLATGGLLLLVAYSRAPEVASLLAYLLAPMACTLTISLITGWPPELATIALEPRTLKEVADHFGYTVEDLSQINGLTAGADPLQPIEPLSELRLPLRRSARRAQPPMPPQAAP